MKTLIFNTYSEFLEREDKEVNGVSPEFAENNPNYEKENDTNKGCWNCSDCSDCSRCYGCYGCSRCSCCSGCSDCSRCYGCSRCSDCSDCSDCYGCSRCSDCSDCSDCYGCSRCSDCYGCSRCSDCSDCSRCSDRKGEKESIKIPIIENIHQTVLDAVCKEGALNMNEWHTCDTTHCRAGWVVTLAGKEGKELEAKTSTEFAALQIYKASSNIKVPPTQFYKSNEVAMDDIERCAKEEKEQCKK